MCMNQSGFFPEFFDLPLLIAISMFLVYYLMACCKVWIITSDATVCCPENSNPALHGTVSSTTVPDRFVVTVTSHWWYWKMTSCEAFSFLFVYEASSSKELHRKSGMWPKMKKKSKNPNIYSLFNSNFTYSTKIQSWIKLLVKCLKCIFRWFFV